MDRQTFADRLEQAAFVARDYSRDCIEEDLPDAIRFRLRLNSSRDASLHKKAPGLESLTLDAPDALFADGRCPKRLGYISLSGKQLHGSPTLPARVGLVNFHIKDFDDVRCEELLMPMKAIRAGRLWNRATGNSGRRVRDLWEDRGVFNPRTDVAKASES